MDLKHYVTVNEAAELRGVSRQAILELIERKRLPAERVGRQWLIPKAKLENFERIAPGRKPADNDAPVKVARAKAKKRR
jgi:excisionase family DNA binding protein